MNREFIETKEFTDLWNKLNLTDDDLRRLQHEILSNPNAGVLVKETGGVRKMRFALPNRGKSGSIRIIFIDFIVQEHIYLLLAFTKDKQSNLTNSQKNILKKLTAILTKDEESILMNNKKLKEYISEEEFEAEDEEIYTDYDRSAFDDFDMFESLKRSLEQAIEIARKRNRKNGIVYESENIKLRINEKEKSMKYERSDYRYSAYFENGDIEESNNKAKLITLVKNYNGAAWVEDNRINGIIYSNKRQQEIDNE